MAESAPERPSFVPYEKMTLSTKVWASQRLDGIKQWVAMEKIHGANFSFTVACQSVASSSRHSDTSADKAGAPHKLPHDRPLSVYAARRGDYLREDENFYGVTSQREFLELQKEKAKCVYTSVIQRMDHTGSEEIMSVTIVGELFGGYYPHPSVEVCRGVSNVQKEVVYCPDIKFCAFDIAVSTANEQVSSRRYLDYDVCIELFKESGFLYAEPLAIGTLQDMISYPLGFESKLPAKFGLPALDKPNVAEGIVIKPVKNAVLDTNKGPKRVIFKRKVEGFAEVKPRRGGKQKIQRVPTANGINGQDYELLKYEMLALITPQRVTNIMSKIGRPLDKSAANGQSQLHESGAIHRSGGVEWKDIVRDLVKDVIEDTEQEHEELWIACQMDGKRIGQVMKEIKEECFQCVEEYKRNNVD